MTSSVAARAQKILSLPGVDEFTVHVVTCRPRQKVKTWHKLERALILTFRGLYGVVPYCNSKGSKMKLKDEYTFFREKRIKAVLEELS